MAAYAGRVVLEVAQGSVQLVFLVAEHELIARAQAVPRHEAGLAGAGVQVAPAVCVSNLKVPVSSRPRLYFRVALIRTYGPRRDLGGGTCWPFRNKSSD